MPVIRQMKEKWINNISVDNTQFRGIIPVWRGKEMPRLRKLLWKDHLGGHVGIQPVVMEWQIQDKKQEKAPAQK